MEDEIVNYRSGGFLLRVSFHLESANGSTTSKR